ncbi:MAG: hypothetical protein H0X45_02275 [Planctomycetes bacterium]|nr:hypothetical protein [Planctomycetota bacterium]
MNLVRSIPLALLCLLVARSAAAERSAAEIVTLLDGEIAGFHEAIAKNPSDPHVLITRVEHSEAASAIEAAGSNVALVGLVGGATAVDDCFRASLMTRLDRRTGYFFAYRYLLIAKNVDPRLLAVGSHFLKSSLALAKPGASSLLGAPWGGLIATADPTTVAMLAEILGASLDIVVVVNAAFAEAHPSGLLALLIEESIARRRLPPGQERNATLLAVRDSGRLGEDVYYRYYEPNAEQRVTFVTALVNSLPRMSPMQRLVTIQERTAMLRDVDAASLPGIDAVAMEMLTEAMK